MNSLHQYDYGNPNGRYVAENGAEWDDLETFVLEGIMGFCGCGQPWAVNDLIHQGLQHIQNLTELRDKTNFSNPESKKTWDVEYKEWEEQGLKLFGAKGSEVLFYYVLDKANLTDHGGSVPGWLSPLGQEILTELNKDEETDADDDSDA